MDRIKLRALTRNDISLTLSWHNQPDIVAMYAGQPFPVNLEMEERWYDRILTSNIPTSVFGIELLEQHKMIGISVLRDIDLINRSAESAIYIGDVAERGRGLAKEAMLLTLDFGFNHLGLNRIWLRVLEENVRAQNLYDGLGFVREGILRNSAYKNGQFKNIIIMSVMAGEFGNRIHNT